MGLKGVEKQYPKQLSGGMRQRVALVRTLATEPMLLMLDEPFSALDYQTKLRLEDLVSNTLKTFSKTAILVTHDIGEAIAMSDRVFLFQHAQGDFIKLLSFLMNSRNSHHLQPVITKPFYKFSKTFGRSWNRLDQPKNNKLLHKMYIQS